MSIEKNPTAGKTIQVFPADVLRSRQGRGPLRRKGYRL